MYSLELLQQSHDFWLYRVPQLNLKQIDRKVPELWLYIKKQTEKHTTLYGQIGWYIKKSHSHWPSNSYLTSEKVVKGTAVNRTLPSCKRHSFLVWFCKCHCFLIRLCKRYSFLVFFLLMSQFSSLFLLMSLFSSLVLQMSLFSSLVL